MPLIQAPAHDFDTLNTVVQRCMHMSEKLGQKYTVITVDQALYFKLMDLKWSVPRSSSLAKGYDSGPPSLHPWRI